MSRRSIYLLAAAVVLLYFSIIILMLSPQHGTKSVYYGNNYMNHFGYRQGPSINWCNNLRWRSPPSPHVVALVSYPGSGNTWMRYLLQQATGIITGSIYMDYGLRVHGFPGENVTDGSVLLVKTHEAPPIDQNKFSSAILLIRNPRDAILADFNRLHKGHIGLAPKSAFKKKSNEHKKSDWANYVSSQLAVWEGLHRMWLAWGAGGGGRGEGRGGRAEGRGGRGEGRGGRGEGRVHVVFYERLVRDVRTTLDGILQFLNYTVSEESMNCAIVNKEGIYRRKKKHKDFDPYTSEMYAAFEVVKNRILDLVTEYQKRHL